MAPIRILLILLFTLSLAAQAQVFKQVDEEGNVTFTDQPAPDSTEVEINTTNTAPPPPVNAFPVPPKPQQSDADDGGYQLKITAPADQTIIPNGPGNFSVSASVSPSLQAGHKLQLLMDGQPREEPQSGSSWALTNVFRGEHSIAVSVIDAEGEQQATSAPITVYVFRPSSNNKNRPNRPRRTPAR
ncbi:MAG: DUF4124 domain-containing protein [Halieaceae bacterium]